MDEDRDQGLPTGRRYIIERPRLTRLLDESKARVLSLFAPAGYGKTTLARQWLASKRHGWYRGTPASADVAALAVGLAEAAQAIVPQAGARMRERLRVTAAPEQDVQPLAELLAEDLGRWPAEAWLAIDDYQFAAESKASERFLELLLEFSPVRLFLTTRKRPAWATTRRLLYGEFFELGTHDLAMTQDEAREVLAHVQGPEAPGLVALAEGWPAVIGLAALTGDLDLPEGTIPEQLYDYFAEELYQAASPEVQWGLCQLALAPSITPDLAQTLLGDGAAKILEEGSRLGFFAAAHKGPYDLHPLLRAFLELKLGEQPGDRLQAVPGVLWEWYVDRQLWDEAFLVAQHFAAVELLVGLLKIALRPLLAEARLTTIAQWLDAASAVGLDAPIVDLAEAEVAFRRGDYIRAQAFALEAARRSNDTQLAVAALCVGGTSAHLRSNDDLALEVFRRARSFAKTKEDVVRSLWGDFIASVTLEREDAAFVLAELAQHGEEGPEALLRITNGRLMLGAHVGDTSPVLEEARLVLPLLARAKDPLVKSSFLNSYAFTLVLAGLYEEAAAIADLETAEAQRFRLDFVLQYSYTSKAAALWGMRDFANCKTTLDHAYRAATATDFFILNATTVRARLHLAVGAPRRAIAALDAHLTRSSTRGMDAEYAAWRGLAHACAGDFSFAIELVSEAEERSARIETRGLAACTRAIVALQQKDDEGIPAVQEAFEVAQRIGNVDALVASYRAHPPLLRAVAQNPDNHPSLVGILRNAHDQSLGKKLGVTLDEPAIFRPETLLTRREAEVYALLAAGSSNREIAQALYISEATVKVHLRRIFEKLGVKTRTEAALRAAADLSH